MATSEGIPSSIDIEFLELNDNPYIMCNHAANSMLRMRCNQDKPRLLFVKLLCTIVNVC